MMRAILLSMALLVGLGACGDENKPPATPSSAAPAEPTPVDPDPGAADSVEPAPIAPAEGPADPAENEACVEQCVQRNQMRAVAHEQIERDCVAECKE